MSIDQRAPAEALAMRAGPLEVEFRPADGGRLARVRYDGVDLVLPPGRVPGFYGDTFWPSPQSRFDWPPPPVLDAGPYDILAGSARELTLRSGVDHEFGLQVVKHVTIAEHGMTLEFAMTNTWSRPQDVAPWQVTRASREGLLVWASGEPFSDADRVQKQREDPGCWYLHRGDTAQREGFAPFEGYSVFEGSSEGLSSDGSAARGAHAAIHAPSVPRTSKFFTDARGWVAHVHHGTIFLRIFPDLSLGQMAPRQAELELFFSTERDYIEVENQGAYVTLAPGESLSYAVEWRFAALDPAIPTDRITPELLAAIDAVLIR